MSIWTQPAYAHITAHNTDPITQLHAALGALGDALHATIPLCDDDPGFDPLAGTTFIDLACANLAELADPNHTRCDPADPFAEPINLNCDVPAAQAATDVSDLLTHTADLILTQTNQPEMTPEQAWLLADTMDLLATAHQATFGTSW